LEGWEVWSKRCGSVGRLRQEQLAAAEAQQTGSALESPVVGLVSFILQKVALKPKKV